MTEMAKQQAKKEYRCRKCEKGVEHCTCVKDEPVPWQLTRAECLRVADYLANQFPWLTPSDEFDTEVNGADVVEHLTECFCSLTETAKGNQRGSTYTDMKGGR